jgi:DNA-binding NarL/FixJ family response regulator
VAFTEAFRHGQNLPLDDALADALDERAETTLTPYRVSAMPLTRRERQIAHLIAQGLSNKEIAGQLVISQRTVESHIEHTLTKLGLNNRTQVAAWITMQDSDNASDAR